MAERPDSQLPEVGRGAGLAWARCGVSGGHDRDPESGHRVALGGAWAPDWRSRPRVVSIDPGRHGEGTAR
jgi:hypothetical protein